MTPLRASSTAFGLVMVAVAALGADHLGLAVTVLGAIAVVVAVYLPWAATFAVLCCVTALTLSQASPVACALAGVTATCFLVLGHAAPPQPTPVPTVVAVGVSTAVGLAVTAAPVALPWAPLAAPPAALVAFVVVVHALRRRVRAAASRPSRGLRENEV